jgi:glycosyltransferase involved in cell wall biosynthesis
MRIVYWGTYDARRERYRILVDGLKRNDVEIFECHDDVWGGIRDKSMVSGWRFGLRIAIRYLFAYIKLTFKYLCLPDHDAVLVGYFGHPDVLVLWPLARLRRKPIVWDALISLYDTIISDRKLIRHSHPVARLIFLIEWVICHSANRITLPSSARAEYLTVLYGLPKGHARAVFLGVESDLFPVRGKNSRNYEEDSWVSVLFYGQLFPMHGIDVIIRAARYMKEEPVNWVIIGSGQVEVIVRQMLEEQPLANLEWIPWVPYAELAGWIHRCDVALGIFGDSEKAATSIPNKVFQILSTGTPLITRDSPAIREILDPKMPGIYLIPPNNPQALVNAIQEFRTERKMLLHLDLHFET